MTLPLNVSSSVPKGTVKAIIKYTSANKKQGCVELSGIRLT